MRKRPQDTKPPRTARSFLKARVGRALAAVIGTLLYFPPAARAFLQKCGVTITPANHYSEIPLIKDIEASFAGGCRPTYCEHLFDRDRFADFLEKLLPYSKEFDPPLTIEDGSAGTYFWKAKIFSYSDAMAYYAIIRHAKPNNVVEIGSGFSSLVALEALKANGFGKLTCIEPYPRKFLKDRDDIDLIETTAQSIDVDSLNSIFTDGDIFFIDSTHTVKHGSDCLHIYLNLLPFIARDVFVHAHDIYLPFSLSKKKLIDQQVYWTEQYLLGAYLMENARTEILYGSIYNKTYNGELLKKFMHGRYPSGGASLWFHQNKRAK